MQTGILDFKLLSPRHSDDPLVERAPQPDYEKAIWFARNLRGDIVQYFNTKDVSRLGLRIGDQISFNSDKIVRFFNFNLTQRGMPERPLYDDWIKRQVAIDPNVPIWLENPNISDDPVTMTTVKAISRTLVRFGYGQKCVILSTPKTGKTWLLQGLCDAIRADAQLPHHRLAGVRPFIMAVYYDERPEEVNRYRKQGVETWSLHQEMTEDLRVTMAMLAFERAKRLVELGFPVVLLFDSLTRFARELNSVYDSHNSDSKPGQGGFHAWPIAKVKQLFTLGNNFEGTGSLTIAGTVLTNTNDKGDFRIVESCKSGANCEIHLQGIVEDGSRVENLTTVGYPAINIMKSETRQAASMRNHPVYATGSELTSGALFDQAMAYRRMLVTISPTTNKSGYEVVSSEENALTKLLDDIVAYATAEDCYAVEVGTAGDIDIRILQRAFNHVAEQVEGVEQERLWTWMVARMFFVANSIDERETIVNLFLDKVLRAAPNARNLDRILDLMQEWFNKEAIPAAEAMEQAEQAKKK